MSAAPWTAFMGAGVAAQFARMAADGAASNGCRLLFVRAPVINDFATWAVGAARESHEVSVIDVTALDTGIVTLVTQGLDVEADIGSEFSQLCEAINDIQLLCIHGCDKAFSTDSVRALSWLFWCAKNLPLTMVATNDPDRYIHQKLLQGCRVRSDEVVDMRFSSEAREHTVHFVNRLLGQAKS
ncbi:hypothetical protein [Nitrogeniibacter aestuarii]|uniref:hypothetical protein n=1 Tax=Nitrogeniibacter aestuarii TaxID=2815343 RepID=UPI001E54EE9D|nr:hypothetical protein [Nitrogeniibacter aestuarii]